MSDKKENKRELLFSLTAKDFTWSYTRGTGNGGQKKNKTSSAVHCKHPPSGAYGYSEASRSQHQNKQTAFEQCINTKEFKQWHKIECMRRNGTLIKIEEEVKKQMNNIKVEIKDEGKWKEVPKNATLDDSKPEEGMC